jgi:hypothetical protein
VLVMSYLAFDISPSAATLLTSSFFILPSASNLEPLSPFRLQHCKTAEPQLAQSSFSEFPAI